MGALLKSLTVACVAAVLLPASAGAAPRCLDCHRPHYADRGGCTGCHRGDERTDRKNIAHRDLIPAAYAHFTLAGSPVVRRGDGLVEAFACRRCHGWRGEGNALAANLDDLLAASSPGQIHDAIRTPAAYMPDFGFAEPQITDIVNAVLAAGARRKNAGSAEVPVVVHFEDSESRTDLLFPSICGPCHKILSDTAGGLGKGAVGPNLSGLLTSHYPKTFGGGRWTRANLKKWLENPRNTRPFASMPPIPLSPEQVEALATLMEVPAAGRAR